MFCLNNDFVFIKGMSSSFTSPIAKPGNGVALNNCVHDPSYRKWICHRLDQEPNDSGKNNTFIAGIGYFYELKIY